jgi:hypothetical protein
MKTFTLLAITFVGVLASAEPDEEYITITEYFDDCSTRIGYHNSSYTATVTGTITDTLPCDECKHTSGIWTTYTTQYVEICPTGLTEKVYTITESCTEENQPRPSTYIPSGFVVTTVACDVCEHPTVTLTTPCSTATVTSLTNSIAPLPPVTTAAPTAAPTTVIQINSTHECETCAENSTTAPIQFAKASITSLSTFIVGLVAIAAGLFVTL